MKTGSLHPLARQAPGSLNWPTVVYLLDAERPCLIRQRNPEPGDVSHLATWVERLREGNRNSGLFWAACRAVEAGHADDLDVIAAAAARAGLEDREILRTIASARRASQLTQHRAEREAAR